MTGGKFKGIHAFWTLAAFFMVMFVVDGMFLYRSIVTFPGEETPKSWLQGIEYNTTLARREAQDELAWTAQIGIDQEASDILLARISGHEGNAIGGLSISGQVRKIGDAGGTREIEFSSRAIGEYAASVGKLMPGRYDIVIDARRVGAPDVVFNARKIVRVESW